MGGGLGGSTNERPGTDHVISGSMRGLNKTAPDGTDRHSEKKASEVVVGVAKDSLTILNTTLGTLWGLIWGAPNPPLIMGAEVAFWL